MKDKEKQIEEMAKVLHDRIINKTWRAEKVAKQLYEIAVPKDSVVLSKVEKQKLLKEMYEQGKFDALADLEKDGKVVLSREEYVELCGEAYDTRLQVYFEHNKASKETAEKYTDKLLDFIHNETFRKGYELKKVERRIKELAKQFGVEIKE